MHSQYVGYTFIIDLIPTVMQGRRQGFIIKEVLNLRLVGASNFLFLWYVHFKMF